MPDRFEQILASLQAAMLDDAHWVAASGLTDDLCGAKGNHLVFSNDAWDDGISVFFMRFCYGGAHRTDLEEEYFTKYYPADEHLPRPEKATLEGRLVITGHKGDRAARPLWVTGPSPPDSWGSRVAKPVTHSSTESNTQHRA